MGETDTDHEGQAVPLGREVIPSHGGHFLVSVFMALVLLFMGAWGWELAQDSAMLRRADRMWDRPIPGDVGPNECSGSVPCDALTEEIETLPLLD